MIRYQCPFLPEVKYHIRRPNCPFSEEAVKRSRRKSIIGQFLWSNGLGDWSANLKAGTIISSNPGGSGVVEHLKKRLGEPLLFCWGVGLGLIIPLGQFPPNVAVGLLASVWV